MAISLIVATIVQCGDVHAHEDQSGATAQTHLPKDLEGRRYYRHRGSSSPAAEEDFNSPGNYGVLRKSRVSARQPRSFCFGKRTQNHWRPVRPHWMGRTQDTKSGPTRCAQTRPAEY